MELKDAVLEDRLKVKARIICRNCDFPMEFEDENPKGYLLYCCPACSARVGIEYHK